MYLAFILFTEYVTIFVNQSYGLFIYVFIPISLLTLFRIKPEENPTFYPILSSATLIRIISISTQRQIISDITLIIILATKELADTSLSLSHQSLGKDLTMVIAPLIISFTLNITNILGVL